MVLDLIESAARRLYLGVCVEARAALATTLAKLRPKQISVLLVADPRRAQELTTEVETYSQWLSPKKALQILHFPEAPPPDIDATRRADRICERLAVLSTLLSSNQQTRLLIATPEALLGACPDRKQFESRQLKLRSVEDHPFKALINTLTQDLDYDSEALC